MNRKRSIVGDPLRKTTEIRMLTNFKESLKKYIPLFLLFRQKKEERSLYMAKQIILTSLRMWEAAKSWSENTTILCSWLKQKTSPKVFRDSNPSPATVSYFFSFCALKCLITCWSLRNWNSHYTVRNYDSSLHLLILLLFCSFLYNGVFKLSASDIIYCVKSVMFLNGKLKRRTQFQKFVCEIQRNKVLDLENATLSTLIESLSLTVLLHSIVRKVHKTNAK